MKTAEQWLSEYARTHANPLNKRIHRICVPLILWSVLALLTVIPKPSFAENVLGLNWGTVVAVLSLGFYWRLGFRYFLSMLGICSFMLITSAALRSLGLPLGWIAIGVFMGAWIGQFYGHKVEGQKPSFFEDLLFLLIGPLWVFKR